MSHKTQNSGMTLMSLLVVIAVLAILTTLVAITINSAKVRTRDSRRISDVKAMREALQLYYNDHGSYPDYLTPGNTLKSQNGLITYLKEIPADPNPTDGSCSGGYSYSGSAATYSISYCLGSGANDLSSGDYQATSLQIAIAQDGDGGGGGEEPATPWLGTWAKRMEITVSNTNIDSDLTHFPLMLKLGTSVGTGSADVSPIFDELTSDANRFKIAVTKSDAETQIYVEIDEWDDASESAVLWVSKSDLTLSSSSNTTLYIYYDSSQSDNTTYVEDAGSRTEVWDSNYAVVHHLSDGVSGLTDSTSNNRDGTKQGDPTETSTAKIGKAQSFDGNDSIDLGNGYNPYTDFTVEAWARLTSLAKDKQVISKGYNGTYTQWEIKTTTADPKVSFQMYQPGGGSGATSSSTLSSSWTYLAGSYDGSTWHMYFNDDTPVTNTATGPTQTSEDITIGAVDVNGSPGQYCTGQLDEIRISDTTRSDAWIKATYHTQTDNLASYGAEETN